MKKGKIDENSSVDNEMLPEYDLTGKKGVRGKYYRAMRQGYTVQVTNPDGTVTITHYRPLPDTVSLDRDVRAYFPDSESVNTALRSLISLIPPTKPRTKTTRSRTRRASTQKVRN